MTNAGAGGAGRLDLDAIASRAMQLAGDRGWENLSLRQVAQDCSVSLADLYRACPGKGELLAVFARHVDDQVLDSLEAEDIHEPAKDRLFEVLMHRFDALRPYREGVRSIVESYSRDPVMAMGGIAQLRRSMRSMLEAADLSVSGLRGEMRLDGLCMIYLLTLRTWLEDESPDMAATMAALDKHLRRVERPAAVLEGVRRPGSGTSCEETAGAR